MENPIPLDYVMVGMIGFLAALLITLMVMPAVHRRAVRLTRRHYDQLPLSMREMRAEKDSLRAGFAAATVKLEMSLAHLRDKTTAHATDLAKKVQLIARLKQELQAVDTALKETEAREQVARIALRDAKREIAGKDAALVVAEQEIAAIRAQIAGIAPARRPLVASVDVRPVETPVVENRVVEPRIAEPRLVETRVVETRPAEPRTVQPRIAEPPRTAQPRIIEIVPLAPLRAPLDVVPPPTRLLTPTTAAQPKHDDIVTRAWTEIRDAAQRLDERLGGAPAFGRRPNGEANPKR